MKLTFESSAPGGLQKVLGAAFYPRSVCSNDLHFLPTAQSFLRVEGTRGPGWQTPALGESQVQRAAKRRVVFGFCVSGKDKDDKSQRRKEHKQSKEAGRTRGSSKKLKSRRKQAGGRRDDAHVQHHEQVEPRIRISPVARLRLCGQQQPASRARMSRSASPRRGRVQEKGRGW